MRAVRAREEFAAALASAKREAAAAFGDDRVLLERLVDSPRHIEVQVFADGHGNVVHLFERDCSLQRRHQKVIEEAPAPGIDTDTRRFVCEAAVRAARAVDYEGAGTIEFIADASEGLRADRIWFMEMNTRLQVEHPVTEAVTGLDLVEWQLRVASGEALPLRQEEIELSGHAIEARLYAEDPANGFLPSVGRLARLKFPDSVRIDTGVAQGGSITTYYDPMIAKLISHAPTREAAAATLGQAVRGIEVWPVKTNAAFLAKCLDHPDFVAGRVETGFIDARFEALTQRAIAELPPGLVAGLVRSATATSSAAEPSPWNPDCGLAGFRLGGPFERGATLYVDGRPEEVEFDFRAEAEPICPIDGATVVFSDGAAFQLSLSRPPDGAGAGALLDGVIRTPMPGRIVSVAVRPGDEVSAGQTLLTLEAMKMEHGLVSATAARVTEVCVSVGDQVSEGAVAARLEPIG